MARTTVEQTGRRIQRQLSSGQRIDLNQLSVDIGAEDSSVQFVNPLSAAVQIGAVLEIELELLHVLDVDRVNRIAICYRGHNDSDQVAHQAGLPIRTNVRFPLMDIVDTMSDEIMSWPPDLYRITDLTVSVSVNGNLCHVDTLQLPLAMKDLIQILRVHVHTTPNLGLLPSTIWPSVSWRMLRGTPGNFDGSTESGLLLRFIDPVYAGSVHIVYASGFDVSTMEMETDLVDEVGLDASMLDVLGMGVKMRLMSDQEHGLSSRDAAAAVPNEVVQPGSAAKDSGQMFAMYLRRRSEEMNKLRRRYPIVRT